jgi:SNF1-activating kinase 1
MASQSAQDDVQLSTAEHNDRSSLDTIHPTSTQFIPPFSAPLNGRDGPNPNSIPPNLVPIPQMTDRLISTPAMSQSNNSNVRSHPEESLIQDPTHMDSHIKSSGTPLSDSNSVLPNQSTSSITPDHSSAAPLQSQLHITKHLWHPTLSIPHNSDIGFGIENPQVTSSHTTIQGHMPNPSIPDTQYTSNTYTQLNTHATKAKKLEPLVSRRSEDRLADPSSAASDPGIFTPKSSPLRPQFRSDTPEPFPTHDLNDWYNRAPKETHSAEVDVDPVSGRKIINDYEIIGELGRGVHGKVKLGRNLQTNKHVAIKIIERISKKRRLGRSGNQEAKIRREIAILKKARHENIVGLLEVIDDPAMKKVYIVLEHVELGEIKWRTSGEDEICLVEYRRCLREIEGITESDAAVQEDQQILETARKNIERREEKAREGYIRGVGPWSLEHGGQSDQGDFPAPPATHLVMADLSHSNLFQQDSSHAQFNEPSTRPNNTLYPVDGTQQVKGHDGSKYSDGFKTEEYHTAIEGHSILDGTMYGPYDTFPQGDELEPANFDSFASSLGEYDVDRIPEHFRYVPVMTLNEARGAIRDTVLGLEYLHYQGVIHRDIKPANLLETKNHRIKISDFGVSYLGKAAKDQATDDQSESDAQDYDEAIELAKTVGTPAFYAPELCRTDYDDDNPPPVTNQIDVWALGVTLYCFIFGRVPFHDQNTFVLMRNIAEQEVYIPRRRLKAIEDYDEGLEMRSTSGSVATSPAYNSNKRFPHDLEYEEVPDELRDLLLKLLTKDPRERLKLTDVKHHAWLLDDIKNPDRWINESDPSRITHGKKIQVSKEDVESAVRLNVVDNIRKFTKIVIGGVIGLGKSHSRTRAKSTAAVPDTQASSNASSSSSISQEVRRHEFRRSSLRPDELIFSALKASRDTDHPLSHSVTASPEVKEDTQFFKPSYSDEDFARIWPGRPANLDRGISGTGSIRTIRPSDFHLRTGSGGLTMSALPSTPQQIETPSTPLGNIFGGVKGRPLRSPAFSEVQADRRRSISLGRKTLSDDDPHAEPSLAISNATAAGLVNLPAALQELNAASSSGAPSPSSSRPPSAAAHVDVVRSREADESMSRVSSVSSVASRGRLESVATHSHYKNTYLPLLKEVSNDQQVTRRSISDETQEEEVARAKEEQLRRLIQEDAQHRSDSITELRQKPTSTQDACPPSPDDFIFERKISEASYHPPLVLPDQSLNYHHSSQQLPVSSSEDRLTSDMSQSTSNRSLPSAISASSSIGMDLGYSPDNTVKYSSAGDFPTIEHISAAEFSHGHVGNMTIDDGEDSDDSFIEMSRPKRPDSLHTSRSTSATWRNGQTPTGHDNS